MLRKRHRRSLRPRRVPCDRARGRAHRGAPRARAGRRAAPRRRGGTPRLALAPADPPVRIRVDNPRRSRIFAIDDYPVRVSPEFSGEVKSLLGPESITY